MGKQKKNPSREECWKLRNRRQTISDKKAALILECAKKNPIEKCKDNIELAYKNEEEEIKSRLQQCPK